MEDARPQKYEQHDAQKNDHNEIIKSELSTPGAFAYMRGSQQQSSSSSLDIYKKRVQDFAAHQHAFRRFFEEGVAPEPGTLSDLTADSSTLRVHTELTSLAIRVLELDIARNGGKKIPLSKEGERVLPEEQAPKLFTNAVRMWLEEHDLTRRIHVEWSSGLTTLGQVVESNGACDCVTTYDDTEPDPNTALPDNKNDANDGDTTNTERTTTQAGPTGRTLTLMLNRRMKPRQCMVASLLDHEVMYNQPNPE